MSKLYLLITRQPINEKDLNRSHHQNFKKDYLISSENTLNPYSLLPYIRDSFEFKMN